jgi:phosphonatase-like hydrolase
MILDQIELIVLDMAGTTVGDTFSVHDSMISAFKAHGFEIDRTIASNVLAVPKPIGIQFILENQFQIQDAALLDSIHQSFQIFMNDYYETNENVHETKGTTQFFNELKNRNIKIALDTGFVSKTASLVVKRLNWVDCLDAVVTSDEITKGRPNPDMIYKAMEETRVSDVQKVIKVGDTPADMKQGKNAGCKWVIGVNSGAFSEEELLNSGADVIVTYPAEILNL